MLYIYYQKPKVKTLHLSGSKISNWFQLQKWGLFGVALHFLICKKVSKSISTLQNLKSEGCSFVWSCSDMEFYLHNVTLRSRWQPGRVRFQQGTLKAAHSGSNRRGCYTTFFPAVTMATRGSNRRGGKGAHGLWQMDHARGIMRGQRAQSQKSPWWRHWWMHSTSTDGDRRQ